MLNRKTQKEFFKLASTFKRMGELGQHCPVRASETLLKEDNFMSLSEKNKLIEGINKYKEAIAQGYDIHDAIGKSGLFVERVPEILKSAFLNSDDTTLGYDELAEIL